MLPNADRIRIQHMLDSALAAQMFPGTKSPEGLKTERLLTSGLIREIEIVGEAALHISKETRKAHRQIPWREIVSMRNRLIHGYYEVDTGLLWYTIVDDLPTMIDQLQQILEDDEAPSTNPRQL